MTSSTKYSGVTAERNVMYFSVTSANCSTSPVLSSAFGRTDLMKPPNSAPKTSSATLASLIDSMAMPSSPIRLTASAPSTRSLMPRNTSLNTAHLAAANSCQPRFELHDFRIAACGGLRNIQCCELCAHEVVVRIAMEDRLVDLPCVCDETLAGVEIGHRERAGDVFPRRLFVRRLED